MANPFLIPDKAYNFLKQVALIILPAVSTLYFTLGEIWGLPRITEVIGTIAAIEVFLGAFLGISTKQYNNSEDRFDGMLHSSIDEVTGNKLITLELNDDLEGLESRSAIVFKVDAS